MDESQTLHPWTDKRLLDPTRPEDLHGLLLKKFMEFYTAYEHLLSATKAGVLRSRQPFDGWDQASERKQGTREGPLAYRSEYLAITYPYSPRIMTIQP